MRFPQASDCINPNITQLNFESETGKITVKEAKTMIGSGLKFVKTAALARHFTITIDD
jgi:hypothetical protein